MLHELMGVVAQSIVKLIVCRLIICSDWTARRLEMECQIIDGRFFYLIVAHHSYIFHFRHRFVLLSLKTFSVNSNNKGYNNCNSCDGLLIKTIKRIQAPNF